MKTLELDVPSLPSEPERVRHIEDFMSAKMLSLVVVLGMLTAVGHGWCQEEDPYLSTTLQQGPKGPTVHLPPDETTPVPTPTLMPDNNLSGWITYGRPGSSCGQMGSDPQLRGDIFLRNGWTVPVGGSDLTSVLREGWAVEGGGRLYFFNNPLDRAWTLDASISNFNNQGDRPEKSFVLPTGPTITVRRTNRTFVNLGFGHQWFLWGQAVPGAPNLRLGADFGGRWGWGRVDTHQIGHLNDVIGGIYAGAFSDLEIPFGAVNFLAGFRCEWGITWSDLVPGDANIQDINLTFNTGIQF